MKRTYKASLFLITSLIAISQPTQAQQPPDVVQSDSKSNTAMGTSALLNNTSGSSNTAAGEAAMFLNTTGYESTAFGAGALGTNITGHDNTAVGYLALHDGNQSSFNTATGGLALSGNQTGNYDTATGYFALVRNFSGDKNAAVGAFALAFNSTGNSNTATGHNALYSNTAGNSNTAFGHSALKNSTGSNNIGLGDNAGFDLTDGSNNIAIANLGIAGESGVIRIGTPAAQTAAYVAGITNSKVTGGAVYVSSTGQLGTLASSERYKTSVAAMGVRSRKLKELRPVSFHLKADPRGAIQYGLIAEEVAQVYPELVIRNDTGGIEGVRYEELAPMLLNEVQRQQQKMDVQTRDMRDMKRQLAALQELNERTLTALHKLQASTQTVAAR